MQRQGEIAVGCSFLCAFCIFQFVRRLHTLYYLHMKMKNIDKLNGRAFERYLTVQFRHLGYHVTLTSYSHDYGADLVLRKWGKKIVVQAKRYERNVGIAAVQEVLVLLLITKLIGQWLLQIATLRKVPEISPKEMK